MAFNKKKYHTGLVVADNDYCPQHPPYVGRSWHIEFDKNKTRLGLQGGHEVSILAANQCAAQKALNLIVSCLFVLSGQPISPFGDIELTAYNEEEVQGSRKDSPFDFRPQCFNTVDIPIACLLAAKASHRKNHIYAIAKYKFSVSLYSQWAVDLEPWSAPHLPISKFPEDHIAFCHAIISSYSVLEELGLEIRASKENPSMLNGEWNPAVKTELEERLLAAGVNLTERILWTLRGPRRKIEKKKQISVFEKMSWSSGPVRDSTVELADAISYTSWLRSFVSSHTIKEVTETLSPYDVISAQHLARRMILESLGFWRYWDKDP